MPFTLKTVLVEEYEQITRQGFDSPFGYGCEIPSKPARNVHNLPATVTIKQVLQHYQRKRGGSDEDEQRQLQVRRFCLGLAKVFDESLRACLLYPEEHPQYEAIMRQERFQKMTPAEIYGCEFLLRMMVRLPILLQAESKSETSLTMGPLLADLIALMQKNRQACFKGSYRKPNNDELLDWEAAVADVPSSADSASGNQSMER